MRNGYALRFSIIFLSQLWKLVSIPFELCAVFGIEPLGMLCKAFTWPGATPTTSHVSFTSTSTTRSRWPTATPLMTLSALVPPCCGRLMRFNTQATITTAASTNSRLTMTCSTLPVDTAAVGGGVKVGRTVSAARTSGEKDAAMKAATCWYLLLGSPLFVDAAQALRWCDDVGETDA